MEGVVGGSLTIGGEDITRATRVRGSSALADKRASERSVRTAALNRMSTLIVVKNGGELCQVQPLSIRKQKKYELSFRWECGGPLKALEIDFSFLVRLAKTHRHVSRFKLKDGVHERTLSPRRTIYNYVFSHASHESSNTAVSLTAEAVEQDDQWPFVSQLWSGLIHIATGWDHLLFLLALIIVATSFWQLILIATCFALAHSLTLGLAFMGWLNPAPEWVESLIALSIVYVGLENFWLTDGRYRWFTVFGFGLIHGFGFGGFLLELNPHTAPAWETLIGFNLGVELGQIMALACVWPLVSYLKEKSWNQRIVVYPVSFGVMAAGFFWWLERLQG